MSFILFVFIQLPDIVAMNMRFETWNSFLELNLFLIFCSFRPRIKIPAVLMMPIAHLVEFMYKLFAPYGMKVPQLTPSRIRLLSCDRTFNCSKAKDRLGYTPIVSLQVAIFSLVSFIFFLSYVKMSTF